MITYIENLRKYATKKKKKSKTNKPTKTLPDLDL